MTTTTPFCDFLSFLFAVRTVNITSPSNTPQELAVVESCLYIIFQKYNSHTYLPPHIISSYEYFILVFRHSLYYYLGHRRVSGLIVNMVMLWNVNRKMGQLAKSVMMTVMTSVGEGRWKRPAKRITTYYCYTFLWLIVSITNL